MPDQWDPTSRDFIEGREDMVVNNYAQYCSVVKTGIGKAKMVIGGEVDACKWSQPQFYTRTGNMPDELLSMGLQTR
jgi:RAT1-interacting protein